VESEAAGKGLWWVFGGEEGGGFGARDVRGWVFDGGVLLSWWRYVGEGRVGLLGMDGRGWDGNGGGKGRAGGGGEGDRRSMRERSVG